MRADIDIEHVICDGCGATAVGPQGNPTDLGPSLHCNLCTPWVCESCGQRTSMNDPCPCWISLDGLPLADLKALFAHADLSIDPRPTTEGEPS